MPKSEAPNYFLKKSKQQTTITTEQNLRKLNIYLHGKGGKVENAKGVS